MTESEAIEEIERWTSILLSAGSKCTLETAEAQKMAIEALEKQIPVKPIEQIRLLGLDKVGKCPSCKRYIDNSRYWLYCECGQKLEWSE